MSDTTELYSPRHYQAALQAYAASKKGKESLVELDRWYRTELRDAVQSRDPKHATKQELVKVVKWKLTRGTWRPRLLSYAEAHTEDIVAEVTTEAFKDADADNIKSAMAKLMELKGIGATTASAVLAAVYPKIPFMSDELLMDVCGRKDYTLSTFMKLYE
eukprot:jgi/Ulvmu1/6151/UM028_0007.1